MNIHLIVDYSFLYYKYKFQLDSGKIRRLKAPIEWNGTVVEKDISQIYYSLKEIEGFRRGYMRDGHNVIVSVCFDMPPKARKDLKSEAAEKYKSNRVKRLTEDDFNNIKLVEQILKEAGHNTYRIEGYEADDIIATLVNEYHSVFDYNIIYTPDLDLIVNINENTGICRYKAMKGYTQVSSRNSREYLSTELKCNVDTNTLMLFKCTVGDKSDNIDGIKKFGVKAFDKLINYILTSNIIGDQIKSELNKAENVEKLLRSLLESGYFSNEQYKQAMDCLELVKPSISDIEIVNPPSNISTRSKREVTYNKYRMPSLIE